MSWRTEVSRSGGALLAVKILRHHHLGGQQRPGLRHFDILLLENDFAGVVGDFGGAPFPFDLVERMGFRIAESAFEASELFAVAGSLLERELRGPAGTGGVPAGERQSKLIH